MTILHGVLRDGKGDGGIFTQLGWVRKQFQEKLGFDPYPGTLNLQVKGDSSIAALRKRAGIMIEPEAPGYCEAKCLNVTVNGKAKATWIIPDVPGYPMDLIELMAPVSLRDKLSLKDGDIVSIELQ